MSKETTHAKRVAFSSLFTFVHARCALCVHRRTFVFVLFCFLLEHVGTSRNVASLSSIKVDSGRLNGRLLIICVLKSLIQLSASMLAYNACEKLNVSRIMWKLIGFCKSVG